MDYGKESAWAAGPVPVVVDEIYSKKSFWKKKRTWIVAATVAVLVLVGVVLGAVYGTKRTSGSQTQGELDTATGEGTASYPTITNSQPTPTSSSGPILKPLGVVPQDIGAAREAERLLLWNLRDEGALWSSTDSGVWTEYSGHQFLVAPISVATSDTTQTAVSVDAVSGRTVYMHFQDGQWGDWQELEFDAQFLRRPSVISRAQGRVDIVNVDSDSNVWIVSYDGSAWSTWTRIGSGISSGVVATSSDENRIDVFGRDESGVCHKQWTSDSGWTEEWEQLGTPIDRALNEEGARSPLAVSWRENEGDSVIDVVIQVQSMYHKTFRNNAWSEWMIISASHEGGEFVDTQSIVKGDGMEGRPFAHMVSRGTNDCIHYNTFNGTDWGLWNYLWCIEEFRSTEARWPTEFLPTFALGGAEGAIDLVMRDVEDEIHRMVVSGPISQDESWSYDNWENFGKPG